MAGPARYTALLDACVLFPPVVADALMSLHVAGLYTARWTARIDDEWINAASRERPDLEDALARRCAAMHEAVPDWEVPAEAYQALLPGLALPDANDVHVLAAAIAGHADCIVTANLKHFPADVLQRHGLESIHPDDFLIYQLDLEPYVALAAFKEMRARRKAPPLGPEEFVERVERSGLFNTAQRLREALALI